METTTQNLPFLRPQSSAFKGHRGTSARTAAIQAMNLQKSVQKASKEHDQSLNRQHRSHMTTSSATEKSHSNSNSSSFNVAPPPPSTYAESSARKKSQNSFSQQTTTIPSHAPFAARKKFDFSLNDGNNSNSATATTSSAVPFRTDNAHVWWPSQFDGLAYTEHFERLVSSSNKTHADLKDAKNAFQSLEMIADTMKGTPASQLIMECIKVLEPCVFRENFAAVLKLQQQQQNKKEKKMKKMKKQNNDNNMSSVGKSRVAAERIQKLQQEQYQMKYVGESSISNKKNQNNDDVDEEDEEEEFSSVILLRDLVTGLEMEAEQLRRDLRETQRNYQQLQDATSTQVREAHSQKVSSEIQPALQSAEVSEEVVQRIHKESSEMATRLQQSLAQQQVVRAKLVDLGMRNVELRHILESQKRAATARNLEDVMANVSHGDAFGGSGSGRKQQILDRSALHVLGDVVASSQTELANLVEYRQKLSNAVLGET